MKTSRNSAHPQSVLPDVPICHANRDVDELFSIDQKAMSSVLARYDPRYQTLMKPEDMHIIVEVLGCDLKKTYLKTEKKYLELLNATKSNK